MALQFLGKDKGGQGGIVINIGSAVSFRPQISTPIYTATKHAILGLSRSCGVRFIHFVFSRKLEVGNNRHIDSLTENTLSCSSPDQIWPMGEKNLHQSGQNLSENKERIFFLFGFYSDNFLCCFNRRNSILACKSLFFIFYLCEFILVSITTANSVVLRHFIW